MVVVFEFLQTQPPPQDYYGLTSMGLNFIYHLFRLAMYVWWLRVSSCENLLIPIRASYCKSNKTAKLIPAETRPVIMAANPVVLNI